MIGYKQMVRVVQFLQLHPFIVAPVRSIIPVVYPLVTITVYNCSVMPVVFISIMASIIAGLARIHVCLSASHISVSSHKSAWIDACLCVLFVSVLQIVCQALQCHQSCALRERRPPSWSGPHHDPTVREYQCTKLR